MLEVLTKHLSPLEKEQNCTVAMWIKTLKDEEQKAFEEIKEKSSTINVAHLFNDLNKQSRLPFKLTAFRSHLRGYCTCQK